jgi:hypothetical protein
MLQTPILVQENLGVDGFDWLLGHHALPSCER